MKKKRLLTSNNKKSIASFLLAFILLISFNFSPLSLFAGVIRDKVKAYKSSTTQSYYANTEIATETNIGAGNYPSSLAKYFEKSSNNFNIELYYNQRYSDLFALKVEEFLKSIVDTHGDGDYSIYTYSELYKKFLDSVGAETLSAYYESKKDSDLSAYPDFIDYFEQFVLTSHEFTIIGIEESQTYVLPAFINKEDENITPFLSKYYEPYIYASFINYLNGNLEYKLNYENSDGLTATTEDFHKDSETYKTFKKIIDDIIVETVAIYSYDHETQNNYVAGIVANDAPSSNYYYYRDNTYEQVNRPSVSYETGQFGPAEARFNHVRYYYFGLISQLETAMEVAEPEIKAEFEEIKTYITEEKESNLKTSPLSYRQVQKGEEGYLGEDYPIYMQYRSIPYVTSNSQYEIYVIMDNLSDSMKATLDALYYFHPVTREEIKEDNFVRENGILKDGEGDRELKYNEKRFYIQIPYNADANITYWYDYLFGYVSAGSDTYYSNFLNQILTDGHGNSNVYLRLKEDTTKIVYINSDEISLQQFKDLNPNYTYDVRAVSFSGQDYFKHVPDDFYEIDSNNFSSYKTNIKSGTKVYFLKEKVYYQTLDTTSPDVYQKNEDDSYVYETTPTPNSSYEQHDVPTDKFETFQNSNKLNQVYILSKTPEETGEKDITVSGQGNLKARYVTQETINSNRNVYVKVPDYLAAEIEVTDAAEDETFTFYYKHITTKQNKIYIVDSTDGAKNNEVYKNLYYEVLTDDEYNAKYYNYEVLSSSDPNYNEDLKLYYKYGYDLTPSEDGTTNEKYSQLFVQNEITGGNAIYIIDDSLTSSDKATYKTLYYTSISSAEYRTNSSFYVQLTEKDIEKYGDKGRYATLYYKYVNSSAAESTKYKIYEYTTNTNSEYSTFYDTDKDFVASDYELITSEDKNFVEGKQLYYKKIRTEKYIGSEEDKQYNATYYYFQSSSNISIKANSYYVISFYLYTNGHVYNKEQAGKDLSERDKLSPEGGNTDDVTASIYFTDTTGNIENIAFENISTKGEWKQYYAFVATDLISSSTLSFSIYLGNKSGIAGPIQDNDLIVNGMVLVDDVKVVLINETDYAKHSIDDSSVLYTPEENEEESDDTSSSTPQESEPSPAPTYDQADKYGNEIIIRDYDNTIRNNSIISNWSDIFDFESNANLFMTAATQETPAKSRLQEAYDEYFKFYSNDKIQSSKYGIFSDDLKLGDDFTDDLLWHFYISRNNFGDKDYQKFLVYKQAYASGKLSASVIDEPNVETKTPKEDDEEDKDKDDSEDKKDEEDNDDVALVDSTFKPNNKVLMLKNTDRQRALGIVTRPFTIKQNEYYKISMWIYSPDKDAKATINLESIQKTQKTPTEGTLLSTSANVNARLKDYTTTPTNEYGWINISFFVEGNAYGDEEVFLALMADANETIYFDNISIQRTTSAIYSNASSDSDVTTYVLTLATSTSLISAGVTNGYFNSVNVTDNIGDVNGYVEGDTNNYTNVDIDYTKPRTAKNWTLITSNSSDVVAGVVPTSKEYLELEKGETEKTFYQKYNNGDHPFVADAKRYASNLFAIHAPNSIPSGLKGDTDRTYTLNSESGLTYKIYSSSISLSANTTYELSFQFFAGHEFKGNMVANIYSGSVDAARLLSSFKVPYDNSTSTNETWDTYTFFMQNGISSSSVYIEIGIEKAVGTCFFQKVTNISSTYTSVNEARDDLINLEDTSKNIFENESLSSYRFVNLSTSSLTIHSQDKNENGSYESKEYTSKQNNSSKNTVGKSGVTVASFYTKSTKIEYYTVTIDKVTYYIKGEEVTDADENTSTVYKLYSDSVFKNEVTEINGKSFTIEPGSSGKTLKVLVGNSKTSYDGTSVEKTTYNYTFSDDIVIGDNFISASELNNNISENVLILSNSLSTDYTSYSPVYTKTLSTSAYYVLKIYVKTSAITSSKVDEDSGLNITISSISTSWTNIDTTKIEKSTKDADENNGFVCYQVLISTNTSSVASFGVQFSLGSESAPCSGYAIIAGVTLESFSSETLFNEYASTLDEDDKTIKRFYGETSSTNDEKEEPEEDDANTTWATFFYIFSSLLLGIVLIVALIAIIVKKHPIKFGNKYANAENIVITPEPHTKKTNKNKLTEGISDQDLSVEENTNSDSDEEGFV